MKKKLKLKKITLSEMPNKAMNELNGGGYNGQSISVTISLSLLYTLSITVSACDDCASYDCASKGCQRQSLGSYCLCSG